uniref:Uncharacterized protein n=1 Tax=Anguilla anguilla TaxID=7936 RepID=A0A0E9VZ26_ANGAN
MVHFTTIIFIIIITTVCIRPASLCERLCFELRKFA